MLTNCHDPRTKKFLSSQTDVSFNRLNIHFPPAAAWSSLSSRLKSCWLSNSFRCHHPTRQLTFADYAIMADSRCRRAPERFFGRLSFTIVDFPSRASLALSTVLRRMPQIIAREMASAA